MKTKTGVAVLAKGSRAAGLNWTARVLGRCELRDFERVMELEYPQLKNEAVLIGDL